MTTSERAPKLVLPSKVEARDLFALEQQLAASDYDSVELRMPLRCKVDSPILRADLAQFILTCAGRATLTLRLPIRSEEGLENHLRRSEPLLLAALVARRVFGFSDLDLTVGVSRARREALKNHRIFLPRRSGISAPTRQSVITASHVLGAEVSPDLGIMFNSNGEWTNSAARTLFGGVDVTPKRDTSHDGLNKGESTATVANPNEEKVVSVDAGSQILRRTKWPNGHPLNHRLGKSGEPIQFLDVGGRLLELTPNQKPEWERYHLLEASDHLGKILFELAQNAEIHGGYSPDNTLLSRRVRSILYERYSATPGAGALGSHYDDFLAAAALRGTTKDTFVALTILDNGMGLAAKAQFQLAMGRISDQSDEIAYLGRALRGVREVRSRPGHGFGLPEVLNLLTELGGFARIRSGSLTLSRDFVSHPHPIGTRDAITDWRFDLESEIDGFSRTGAAISVVVPASGS